MHIKRHSGRRDCAPCEQNVSNRLTVTTSHVRIDIDFRRCLCNSPEPSYTSWRYTLELTGLAWIDPWLQPRSSTLSVYLTVSFLLALEWSSDKLGPMLAEGMGWPATHVTGTSH